MHLGLLHLGQFKPKRAKSKSQKHAPGAAAPVPTGLLHLGLLFFVCFCQLRGGAAPPYRPCFRTGRQRGGRIRKGGAYWRLKAKNLKWTFSRGGTRTYGLRDGRANWPRKEKRNNEKRAPGATAPGAAQGVRVREGKGKK